MNENSSNAGGYISSYFDATYIQVVPIGKKRMIFFFSGQYEPSNCNFDRVTLTVERKRSTYCTARKSVSSFNLYSSATSISQSIRIVRMAELISD
jgi:hypothetical protein